MARQSPCSYLHEGLLGMARQLHVMDVYMALHMLGGAFAHNIPHSKASLHNKLGNAFFLKEPFFVLCTSVVFPCYGIG